MNFLFLRIVHFLFNVMLYLASNPSTQMVMKNPSITSLFWIRVRKLGCGIARVCKEAYPDYYAFDEGSDYFDSKSSPDNPRWWMVDVEFVSKIKNVDEPLGLSEIKSDPKLADMELIRYGRLSVQSVKKSEFDYVKTLAGL